MKISAIHKEALDVLVDKYKDEKFREYYKPEHLGMLVIMNFSGEKRPQVLAYYCREVLSAVTEIEKGKINSQDVANLMVKSINENNLLDRSIYYNAEPYSTLKKMFTRTKAALFTEGRKQGVANQNEYDEKFADRGEIELTRSDITIAANITNMAPGLAKDVAGYIAPAGKNKK